MRTFFRIGVLILIGLMSVGPAAALAVTAAESYSHIRSNTITESAESSVVRLYNNERYHEFLAVSFAQIESISIARLDGSRRLGIRGLFARTFHHYRVISEWKQVDSSITAELAGVLKERIDAEVEDYRHVRGDAIVELSSFCVPNPGLAVKMKTDRGERDFWICLRCGEVGAYGGHGKETDFSVDAGGVSKLEATYGRIVQGWPGAAKDSP